MNDCEVVAEADLGKVQRTAQSLAPTLQAILREMNWEPKSVELVAVTGGPGSFTGLRAGITTAKVFAYATEAQVLAVNTLEVIAAQSDVSPGKLWAVMDAQRQQVFAAQFDLSGKGQVELKVATRILDNAAWIKSLSAGVAVTGTGLMKLKNLLPKDANVVREDDWAPRAVTLGLLAFEKHQAGARSDYWQLAPQYFRKSAAEEKFEQGLLK